MANDPHHHRHTDSGLDGPRRTARRQVAGHLPTSRAVVGGLLVALAAAGVLVAHRTATRPPATRYVVATREIVAGQPIRPDDLGTIAVDLPGEISAVPAADASTLIGRTAASSVEPFDLVRPGDVLAAGRFSEPESVEVALDLPPARALQGVIRAGSRVDILSTHPEGDTTSVLATDVRVTSTGSDTEGDGIGGSGSVRVLVSVSDSAQATALVDASLRSDITLVLPRPRAGTT